MPNRTDARATLESSIISGLSKNAHLTGARADVAHIQVRDLIDEIFHPSVIWAVRQYIIEIDQERREIKQEQDRDA